jgi:hypothetical protein
MVVTLYRAHAKPMLSHLLGHEQLEGINAVCHSPCKQPTREGAGEYGAPDFDVMGLEGLDEVRDVVLCSSDSQTVARHDDDVARISKRLHGTVDVRLHGCSLHGCGLALGGSVASKDDIAQGAVHGLPTRNILKSACVVINVIVIIKNVLNE